MRTYAPHAFRSSANSARSPRRSPLSKGRSLLPPSSWRRNGGSRSKIFCGTLKSRSSPQKRCFSAAGAAKRGMKALRPNICAWKAQAPRLPWLRATTCCFCAKETDWSGKRCLKWRSRSTAGVENPSPSIPITTLSERTDTATLSLNPVIPPNCCLRTITCAARTPLAGRRSRRSN